MAAHDDVLIVRKRSVQSVLSSANPSLGVSLPRAFGRRYDPMAVPKPMPLPPISEVTEKLAEKEAPEKPVPKAQLPQRRGVPGKLELAVKINALPLDVKTVKDGWKQFLIDTDSCKVSVTMRPRNFKKIVEGAEKFPLWVATITGKIGSLSSKLIVLDEASVQIFERKPKDSGSRARRSCPLTWGVGTP